MSALIGCALSAPSIAPLAAPKIVRAPESHAIADPPEIPVDSSPSTTPSSIPQPAEVAAEDPPVDVDDPADDASNVLADAYGALDDASCFALLKKRDIPFVVVPSARGVETPIRLTGPLHGVDFHGGEPVDERTSSPTEIVDCRLALALDSFAEILERHGVKEAVHWSIYRAPPPGDPSPPADHRAALAIDLGALFESDGSRTGVLEDWHGEIGAKTCGNGAWPTVKTKRAWRLRAILCETAKAHIFHLVLTPNFNAAHHDHFHLEIKRHSTFSLVK